MALQSGDPCDEIAWLVNLLGTVEFLEALCKCDVVQMRTRPPKQASQVRQLQDGLYFSGAHWYSKKGDVMTDAYTKEYQKPGTAHFCQSFAVMIHLEFEKDYKLAPLEYAKNIAAAMEFWSNIFADKDNKEWVDFLLSQSEDCGGPKDLTLDQLLQMFANVGKNAQLYVNCKTTE